MPTTERPIPNYRATMKHASIRDADVRRLCENIIFRQESQIDQMKAKLREPGR